MWQFRVGGRAASGGVDSSWGASLDVDGDGLSDVAIGADSASARSGAVYVYQGDDGMLDPVPHRELTGPSGTDASFGRSLGACDLNGDGFVDLIVGAPNAMTGAGAVFVYPGSEDGVGSAPSHELRGPDGELGLFGQSVAGVGDVNGDGYGDIVVGASGVNANRGAAYIYLGSEGGVRGIPQRSLLGPDPGTGFFGESVAGIGDIDGDGFADVAVGALGVDSERGSVYLYRGSSAGVEATASATLNGPDRSGNFGISVASAGDVNGDGFSDIIVGAPNAAFGAGAFYLYQGSVSGVPADPSASVSGPDGIGGFFGGSVAGAGDIDGDGFSDVVVGARWVDGDTGHFYVYRGSARGLAESPDVEVPGPGGTGGLFGTSVSGAGDVDGDGSADIVVGAPLEEAEAGAAYVYFGDVAIPGPVVLAAPAGGQFGRSVHGSW